MPVRCLSGPPLSHSVSNHPALILLSDVILIYVYMCVITHPVSRNFFTDFMNEFHVSRMVPVTEVFITQSCPTLCDPMDCSPPGSSVPGILQMRILQWVATPFSRGSSRPKDRTKVSHTAGRFFTI